MGVSVKRLEQATGNGWHVVIGSKTVAGRSLYFADGVYGGKRNARLVAEEVRDALAVLASHFPNVTIKRNGLATA